MNLGISHRIHCPNVRIRLKHFQGNLEVESVPASESKAFKSSFCLICSQSLTIPFLIKSLRLDTALHVRVEIILSLSYVQRASYRSVLSTGFLIEPHVSSIRLHLALPRRCYSYTTPSHTSPTRGESSLTSSARWI